MNLVMDRINKIITQLFWIFVLCIGPVSQLSGQEPRAHVGGRSYPAALRRQVSRQIPNRPVATDGSVGQPSEGHEYIPTNANARQPTNDQLPDVDVGRSPAGLQAPSGYKFMRGVDSSWDDVLGRPATWEDERPIPWEAFSYGEYVGPYRTPHVPEYRLRVDDVIEFVFQINRELSQKPYRIYVGDELRISSLAENDQGDDELLQPDVTVLPDGTISLRGIGRVMAAGKTLDELQADLNQHYKSLYTEPKVVVHGTQVNTPLRDLLDSVDARQGVGGQGSTVTVAPDGTVQLPLIGSVPAVGLSLDELAREVNMRYAKRLQGVEVTPVLSERAPRVAYVLGQVTQPSAVELTGPTTVMQAIAQAQGWLQGANVRQIIVFRRDAHWRLMALRLDLNRTFAGQNPLPSDDIWLRHGDIVLVPKAPIQRLSELVDLYFTRTIYSALPQQGVGTIFDADAFIADPILN